VRIFNIFNKKKLKNYLNDKIYILVQFFKDSFSTNFFLESENKVNFLDFRNTIEKLKIKKINIPLRRLGPDRDGGYLVPDCLHDCKYLFSIGVGSVSDFEMDFINYSKLPDYNIHNNRQTFLLDKLEYTDQNYALSNDERLFKNFENKWLGTKNDDSTITLDNFVNSKEHIINGNKNLVLQMDIEANEYVTILATSDKTLLRFKILVIELHYLHYLNNRVFSILFNSFMDKILENFILCHLHPNNGRSVINIHGVGIPKLLEATFIRKDQCKLIEGELEIPHSFDKKNLPHRKSVKLDDFFYKV
jgi:hypothetical protein